MNKLLAGDIWNNLLDILMKTNVIVALVLAAVGVAVAVLSKRVAFAMKKTKDVNEAGNLILVLKGIGLILIVVALVLIIIP